jgi:beta-lactamase superfamily II metal-dependent hydrolase
MAKFKYASNNEATIYESILDGKGKKPVNKILMGTYIKIVEEKGEWTRVETAGPEGWMKSSDLSDDMGLKIFFLDVGQGDGVLLEVGGYKILIDAGPNNSMYNYLTKWQYKYLLDKGVKIHIDYLIVSHFDIDHYKGFIKILNDQRFTFGTIVHPGILKFATKDNPYNSGLGNTVSNNGNDYLTTIFDNLLSKNETAAYNRDVTAFMNALQNAQVQKAKRFKQGDVIMNKKIEGQNFKIEVLAPFLEQVGNKKAFLYWKDDGKTINGHSLVLKVTFGSRTILLGGDLNTLSQNYLMEKYAPNNPFEVDVAKSCHHGSSDFTEKFMKLINPYATVISSGDNEGHAHPRADAIGCAGKYSKSKRPLVYSTELARSTDLKNQKILYGMINLRCNGKDIYMSQMKEVKKDSDLWDSYEVK